ncbi:hypothetical protein [Piscinibacter sakaiensis]|uniref:hypothetical protein n=1 Tax=Piscinibacter sakaiensis TaxID=1547922 RepID=UPI003AAEEB59
MAISAPRALLQTLDLITKAPASEVESLGAVRAAHANHLRTLSKGRNIVGVGISEKTIGDETAGELSLCFYVKKKVALASIRGTAMIPPSIALLGSKAILTDVKEIGEIKLHHAVADPRINSGDSVSHLRDPAGTLGAIVKRANLLFLLSNSHVIALSGKANINDPIISPGTTDGGSLANTIARLSSFVPFDPFGDNEVDAALAEIVPAKRAQVVTGVAQAALPIRTGLAQRGMLVAKFGKSTLQTSGQVMDVNFRLTLRYPHNLGNLSFVNQVLCTHFATNGDSGSIVVDTTTGRVVGLHFAGSDTVSVFNPIGPVMSKLGFTFA